MFYGVEYNTDMRCPNTKVQRFRSRKAAMHWKKLGGKLAFPGAATHDIPASQQNWHHRVREVYETPVGWRPSSKKRLVEKARMDSTPTYPRGSTDALAHEVRCAGDEVRP